MADYHERDLCHLTSTGGPTESRRSSIRRRTIFVTLNEDVRQSLQICLDGSNNLHKQRCYGRKLVTAWIGKAAYRGVLEASTSPLKERYAVSNDSVTNLIQPGTFDDQLTDVLRNGARALLAQAVEAEVADFLARYSDLKTSQGHRRIVRHGYLPGARLWPGSVQLLCVSRAFAIAKFPPPIQVASASRLRSFRLMCGARSRGGFVAVPLPEWHLNGWLLRGTSELSHDRSKNVSAVFSGRLIVFTCFCLRLLDNESRHRG
jgi:hypothetical protein